MSSIKQRKKSSKKSRRRHSTRQSKKHSKKHNKKHSKRHSSKTAKKMQKKGNITYSPKKRSFILSHTISRHQRDIFLGNTLHHTLAKFTPIGSCDGLCTDKI